MASRIRAIVEGRPQRLLEAVAQTVADDLLAWEPRLAGVRVALDKPHVAVPGVLQSLGGWRMHTGVRLGGTRGRVAGRT